MRQLIILCQTLLLIVMALPLLAQAQHPNLILTQDAVEEMRAKHNDYPLFKSTLDQVKKRVTKELQRPINVPYPKDAGGGYTHEQHKNNQKTLYNLGVLYQLTGDTKYSDRSKEIFLAYAKMYPSLGDHPKKKEQSPGRLFWQSLNEAVWLVTSIQGYDAIVETLSTADRATIENDLLLKMASFLSVESPQTFNKIHNHGTWAVAAVGMTGYVLNKDELVQQALYGLAKDGKAGFLKQLDELFSPDGYYNEGPYYQRYALRPFVIFAKAIDTRDPDLKIFEYRDGILLKAIYSALQLSYNKLFFPINDAIKDKSTDTIEMVHGVSIAYGKTDDASLLSIALGQPSVSLTADGLALAEGVANGAQKPFPFQSMLFKDGSQGKQGALAVIRSDSSEGHQALIIKNTSQGQNHGHFDKLNWIYYDAGHEIVSDYGASRFLNVEAKYGGHYLPENKTWAKQTIAHNSLVVDETSHFKGKLNIAEKHHPEMQLFDVKDNVQISSASVDNTYPGLQMTRTMAMITLDEFKHPLILDILRVDSSKKHKYDLPVHYQGQFISTNFPLKSNTKQLKPFGKANGYQHLWVKAKGKPVANQVAQFTWLNDKRFYSYSAMNTNDQQFYFNQLGATDPNFNLRQENSLVQRIAKGKNHTFVSILETHGEYNPTVEYTVNSKSRIKNIELSEEGDLDYVTVTLNSGKQWGFAISYSDKATQHSIEVDNQQRQWTGYYKLFND